MDIKRFSLDLSVFHGRAVPEEGVIVGYGAIIQAFQLAVPIPAKLAFVSTKKRQFQNDVWKVYSSRYLPEENLYKQLIFAFKYEGIDLLVFKKLFEKLPKLEVENMIQQEVQGQYSRRIWFLYEWLMDEKLNLPDLKTGNLVPLIDENLQYAIEGVSSPRHKVINNLPGTRNFCPLIRKTKNLERYIQSDIRNEKSKYLNRIHKDVLQRASSYLLLKDSKASFTIEGENPRNNRAARWGNAIGQAGKNELTLAELDRLQQLVIENDRFIKMGIRKQQGFVGDRDRVTQEPIPDHISAKFEDLDTLMNGLIQTQKMLTHSQLDPVLTASVIAFGFVFIHPFVDGNGRLHRYIIHHILAETGYTEQGIIFPVSASILSHIKDYAKTLESYSHPVLNLIDWKPAPNNNVEILNETLDYYRYFDATNQAEFLYFCVNDTMENIIPNEVQYLEKYDQFKRFIDDNYEMPDNMVSLLVGFLEQGKGTMSKRSTTKEFSMLKEKEIHEIQSKFRDIFELRETIQFTPEQTKQSRIARNKDQVLEIRKITLIPLFQWSDPNEWSRTLFSEKLKLCIESIGANGVKRTSQYVLSSYITPFSEFPIFELENPIVVPELVNGIQTDQAEFPMKITFEMKAENGKPSFSTELMIALNWLD